MEHNLAEFDAAYRERLQAGLSKWHPGDYDDFEMRSFLEAMIAASTRPLQGCRVLDLGCGTGQVALFMASRGASVTGVDCSPSAIDAARQVARQRQLEVGFNLGDVRRIDLTPGHYDLILDCRFLHCVVDWADRTAVLRKVHVALKLEGELWSETMVGVPRIRSGQGFHLDNEGVFWKALPGDMAYTRTLERDGERLSPIRRIHRDVAQFNAELGTAGFVIAHQEIEPPQDDYSVWMVRTRAIPTNMYSRVTASRD